LSNNIHSALLIFSLTILTILVVSQVPAQIYADVPSPKKQTNIGIGLDEIVCKRDLVKVFRINSETVSCFKPASAQKLIDSGLAQEVSKEVLEAKKLINQAPPIGTVKSLTTINQFGSEGKLSTQLRVVEYLHIFEVCALDKTIRAPEVLITSDSETKTVKLAQSIPANKCYVNSAKIKATNTDSISVILTNKGLVTDKLNQLETKIADLQTKLNKLKADLPSIIIEPSTSDDALKKRASTITNEISQLRVELNQAKGELYKYQFALLAPKQVKAADFAKQKLTFTGQPFTDASASVMTVSKQTTGTGGGSEPAQTLYNVVFEACSGKDIIRAPQVRVTSDMEEKTIMVSEKIPANSCQMSAAKINAKDPKTITASVANKADTSMKITELDAIIVKLSEEQRSYQDQLSKLLVQSEKPEDYEQKLAELAGKIVQLRNEIRDAKFQQYGSLYSTYKTP